MLLVASVSLGVLFGGGGRAQEIRSLELVSADVAFYSGFYNLKDLVQSVVESRAVQRLKGLELLPVLKRLVEETIAEASDEGMQGASLGAWSLEQFQERLQNPAVQEILAVLADMHSQEVFVAGDETWSRLSLTYSQLGMLRSLSGIVANIAQVSEEGDVESLSREEILSQLLEEYLSKVEEAIQVPRLVIGWRARDVERVATQINMLRGLLGVTAMGVPQLAGRVRNEVIDGTDFTLIVISGTDVPWEEILTARRQPVEFSPEEIAQLEPEIAAAIMADAEPPAFLFRLVERLRDLQLVIALGMRDDWVLLGLGPDVEMLKLPAEDRRLSQRAEVREILARVEGKPNALSYASGSWRGGSSQELSALDVARDVFFSWAERQKFPKEVQSRLEKLRGDLERLEKIAAKSERKQGASVAVSWCSSRGLEELILSWAEGGDSAPEPLGVLQFLGGDPIAAMAVGRVPLVDIYEFVAWGAEIWMEPLLRASEEGFEFEDEQERRTRRNILARLRYLGGEFDHWMRTDLLPAFEPGEMAFLLDAKMKSRQPVAGLPYSEKPLPVPELALVVTVRDRSKLEKAFQEGKDLWAQLWQILEDSDGPELEELGLPPVECRETPAGRVCQISLETPNMEFDPRLRPTLIVGEKVLVLCLSAETAERLLQAKPLEPVGLLEEPNKPRSLGGFLSFHRLWDAVELWAQHLTSEALRESEGLREGDREILDAWNHDLKVIFALFRCLRSISVEVTRERPSLTVTRTLVEIRDLEQ
jgi:hypothetical protein